MGGAGHHRIAGAITFAGMVFLIAPLLVVVLFSFQGGQGLTFPIEGLSFRWYSATFSDPEVQESLKLSLLVAFIEAGTTLVLGTATAYAITRMNSRLRTPLSVLYLLPLAVPALIIGTALLSLVTAIGITQGLVTILIGQLILTLPIFIILARIAFERLDPALEESAADLGASAWTAFRRVTLPQVLPTIIGATAVCFMLSFDEFFITFLVAGSEQTIPLLIFARMRTTITPTINVISTMLLLATLLVFVAAWALSARAARRRGQALELA